MWNKISVLKLIGAILSMVAWLIIACVSVVGFIYFCNFMDQSAFNGNIVVFIFHKFSIIAGIVLIIVALGGALVALLVIIKLNQTSQKFTIICFIYNLVGFFSFFQSMGAANAVRIIIVSAIFIAEVLFITVYIIYKVRKHRNRG